MLSDALFGSQVFVNVTHSHQMSNSRTVVYAVDKSEGSQEVLRNGDYGTGR